MIREEVNIWPQRRSTVGRWLSRDDDDVYYISERLQLEGETENMGVCTKKREGMTAESTVLLATPCIKSQGTS